MDSKTLLKGLRKHGWVVVRTRGSHHQLKHPDYELVLTVLHPKKDLPKGTLKAILKAARLEKL